MKKPTTNPSTKSIFALLCSLPRYFLVAFAVSADLVFSWLPAPSAAAAPRCLIRRPLGLVRLQRLQRRQTARSRRPGATQPTEEGPEETDEGAEDAPAVVKAEAIPRWPRPPLSGG